MIHAINCIMCNKLVISVNRDLVCVGCVSQRRDRPKLEILLNDIPWKWSPALYATGCIDCGSTEIPCPCEDPYGTCRDCRSFPCTCVRCGYCSSSTCTSIETDVCPMHIMDHVECQECGYEQCSDDCLCETKYVCTHYDLTF